MGNNADRGVFVFIERFFLCGRRSMTSLNFGFRVSHFCGGHIAGSDRLLNNCGIGINIILIDFSLFCSDVGL